MRSEGREICAKTENRTFARGGGEGRGAGWVSKKQTSVNKGGGGGAKNHPIYAIFLLIPDLWLVLVSFS